MRSVLGSDGPICYQYDKPVLSEKATTDGEITYILGEYCKVIRIMLTLRPARNTIQLLGYLKPYYRL